MFLCFGDSNNRKACLDRLLLEEREHLHQLIANLLLRELPDVDTKAHDLAHHLLHIANNIEGCRWLINAGIYLQSFRHEDALQCYNKAILDLSTLSGEEADNVYAEVAIKYAKISNDFNRLQRTKCRN